MKTSRQNATSEPSVRILRSVTCPTLSGRSQLRYDLGCKDGSQILLRIIANSASGSFNRDWIDMEAVKSALEKGPRGSSITSDALQPLFRGKSVNNQLFMFAILVHEGLVRRSATDKRGYERVDSDDVAGWARAQLQGAGAAVSGNRKSKPASSKSLAQSKKPSASKKK